MDILFYPYLQPRRLFLSFLLVSCSVKYTVASPFPVPQVSDFLLSREVQYSSEDALILASSDQGWSSSSSSSSLDDSNLFDPTGYNNIDGGSTTNLFGSGGGGGIAGLDDNESFQVAVNPPEDDGSIHVGQEVDPTRWYEGHLEGTDIFIHCCEDIEAQLQEGCIRTLNCGNAGQKEEAQGANTPPQIPLEIIGGAVVAGTAAAIGWGQQLAEGVGLLWNAAVGTSP